MSSRSGSPPRSMHGRMSPSLSVLPSPRRHMSNIPVSLGRPLSEYVNVNGVNASGALSSARSYNGSTHSYAHRAYDPTDGGNVYRSQQHIPLRHIPVGAFNSSTDPSEHHTAYMANPVHSYHLQSTQALEYLKISDVDSLRSLIEKLIQDADTFSTEIWRKEQVVGDLQMKVMSLEQRQNNAGATQGSISDKFGLLQRTYDDELHRVVNELDSTRQEAQQFRQQALHHATYRDEALREGEQIKREYGLLELEDVKLKEILGNTQNALNNAETRAFEVSEALRAQRLENAGLKSEVGNYHSMRDRNKLRAVQMIVRKWSKFMLMRPFAKWRQNAVEFAEWRQKGHKAVMRMVRANVVRGFNTWVGNHMEANHLKGVMSKIVQRWRHRLLAIPFDTWRTHVDDKKKTLGRAKNIILRMLNATVARALSSWVDTVTSRKAIQAKIKRVLYKWTHGTITLAFNQWTMGIDIRKRQGLIIGKVMARWTNQTLWSALDKWQENIAHLHAIEKVKTKVLLRMLKCTLWIGFNGLLTSAHARRQLFQVVAASLKRWKSASLTKGWWKWRENHAFIVKARVRAVRALWHWQKKGLARAWEKWTSDHMHNMRMMAVTYKIVARWRKKGLARAWEKWTSDHMHNMRMMAVTYKIVVRWQNMCVAHAFSTWSQLIVPEGGGLGTKRMLKKAKAYKHWQLCAVMLCQLAIQQVATDIESEMEKYRDILPSNFTPQCPIGIMVIDEKAVYYTGDVSTISAVSTSHELQSFSM